MSSAKFDEYNNKFVKVWSPGSEIMLGTYTSILSILKIDLSDHPLIKYAIFAVNVNLPPRGTPIVIAAQYYEHHSILYISQSTNNSPWNYAFPDRNRTNVYILIIGRK